MKYQPDQINEILEHLVEIANRVKDLEDTITEIKEKLNKRDEYGF